MFIRSRGLPRRRAPQQLQVLCLAKLHRQPGTRQSPVAHDRLRRHSKGLRCFFDAQPSKKPKLDDLGATGPFVRARSRHRQGRTSRLLDRSQLVARGKHLEQEVSTRRQCESDRSEGPNDGLHRA